jgi:hypothetical protein
VWGQNQWIVFGLPVVEKMILAESIGRIQFASLRTLFQTSPGEKKNGLVFGKLLCLAYNRIFVARYKGGLELDLHGCSKDFRFSFWVKVESAGIVNKG